MLNDEIYEMAKAIGEAKLSGCKDIESCSECPRNDWCIFQECAQILYNAGYRKQSEGEWKDRYNGKYANSIYECSLCKEKALWKIGINELGSPKITQTLSPFCPNCGAKMKGGAE